jgi:hypothetical protein
MTMDQPCKACGSAMREHAATPTILVCANDKCGASIDLTPPYGPSVAGMFGVYASKIADVRAKFAKMARNALERDQ